MFGLTLSHKINRSTLNIFSKNLSKHRSMTSGNGDIRGGGGSFGKKEKAQEEQYFRQKEKEELAEFKKKIDDKSSDSSKKGPPGKPKPSGK